MSGGGRDGGGVTGKKAVKPVTAVQDCVSITIMDIFDEKLGASPVKKTWLKHNLYLTLTKWFLCLNLAGPQAQRFHNIKLKSKIKHEEI